MGLLAQLEGSMFENAAGAPIRARALAVEGCLWGMLQGCAGSGHCYHQFFAIL